MENLPFSQSDRRPIIRHDARLKRGSNILIAHTDAGRVEAAEAIRGTRHVCPNCLSEVILKRGRIVIAHFAHKPPVECDWARGETLAHMEAKRIIAESFVSRGLRAEIEWPVPTLPSHRRADVMVWNDRGDSVAVELQHTAIDLDEIEARAFSYAGAGIAQIWIPFLSDQIWDEADAVKKPDGRSEYFVRRYPARPFERWIHGFNFGLVPYFDPTSKVLWFGSMEGHWISGDGSTWYDQWGQEQYSAGYNRWSKRWRELTLVGPYQPKEIRILPKRRTAKSLGHYHWPGGWYIEPYVPRERRPETPTVGSGPT